MGDHFARRDAVARHYLHLGSRIEREFILGREEVKLKKLFYALRPAAALRWLRAHPDRAVAPMALPVLMAQSDPPAEVAEAVRALIARKALTREMGSAPAPAGLVAFIRAEFEAAAGWEAAEPPAATGEAREAAAALYRATVERLDAGWTAERPAWWRAVGLGRVKATCFAGGFADLDPPSARRLTGGVGTQGVPIDEVRSPPADRTQGWGSR